MSVTRRDLLQNGGLLAAFSGAATTAPGALQPGPKIYESIGVRPIINCRGTLTIIGGSLELPEVRAAKEAAAAHFVPLEELMEAVGHRLAELTGAEWGIVTSGCAAAMTVATAACVAGANPDKHVRIPNLHSFAKDEVIIPKHSRNVYDAAIRAVGVRVIEVTTPEELQTAIGPRTAMIYIFAGPRVDSSALSLEAVARIARPENVPVLVDAAAEILTIPNLHLQRGATMVAYSGGKCIRGPQCAGILLGRKDLVKSAWIHSAPHHGFARAMKVGKEEIIGMLMAVEMWVRRDHKAEWARWLSWLDHIAKRVSRIDGVTTDVRQPTELSNRSPSLAVRWDPSRIDITGAEVSRLLYETEPRIALGGGGRGRGIAGVSVTAYMMSPGDEKIVADRLHAVLSAPPKMPAVNPPDPPATDLSGRWDVHIEFTGSTSEHTLHLRQTDGGILGTHQGDYVSRELSGSIEGNNVRMASSWTEQNGDSLMFRFEGKATGDTMSGTLDMGEYLQAKWTAKKHAFRGRSGV
jgi:L-seryl-tRNA(Ser) seleniumtransferase